MQKGGDRAMVFLKRNGEDVGHTKAVFIGEKGDLRIDSKNGVKLNDYLHKENFQSDLKLMVFQNIKESALKDNQIVIRRQIINNKCNLNVNKVGNLDGERFGVNFKKKGVIEI